MSVGFQAPDSGRPGRCLPPGPCYPCLPSVTWADMMETWSEVTHSGRLLAPPLDPRPLPTGRVFPQLFPATPSLPAPLTHPLWGFPLARGWPPWIPISRLISLDESLWPPTL